MEKFISNSAVIKVEDYPYGFRNRTTLYDWVEFDKNKGFRRVTQTINPSTGRLNNPKKGTYNDFMVRYYNKDGHIKSFGTSSINGLESIIFVVDNFKKAKKFLTKPQKDFLKLGIIANLKVDIKAKVIYSGLKADDLIPMYNPFIEPIVQDLKENTFNFLDLDFKGLHEKTEAMKDPNFNPFKTVKHE